MDAVAVTPALVRAAVDAQFPGWAGLPLTPVSPGGWDNRSFRLGPELLVRVPSRAANAAQVAVEQEWLPRLAPFLPLPIPEPVAEGQPSAELPWAWSVYRWRDGEPLRDAAPVNLSALARDLAGFLAARHGIDTSGAPAAGAGNFHRGGDLTIYGAEVRAALHRIGGSVDIAAAERVWSRAVAGRWPGPPVWVHGDVTPGNLLMRDGRLAAVIDWGQACVGDPACDLAFTWTTLDGPARAAFRRTLPLDEPSWDRGAGWALWKALVVAAGLPGTDRAQTPAARATLAALLGPAPGSAADQRG